MNTATLTKDHAERVLVTAEDALKVCRLREEEAISRRREAERAVAEAELLVEQAEANAS